MTRIRPIDVGIVGLTLATAAIHVVLAIPETIVPFFLNALGYLALLAAFYWPALHPRRHLVRWAFIGYTALTILFWVILGQPYTPLGLLDKAIELALIGLLWTSRRVGR